MEGSAPAVEQSPKSSFESQFSNKQKLKTPEGNLTFVDIKPERETGDKTPILVIPGWSITLKTEKPLLQSLHNSGIHTIAVELPRFGGKVEGKEEIPAEVVRQAELLARLISERPVGEKIDVVGQSMATMSLLAAAKIEPGILSRIRNVVFVSPAGISGNDNIANLASRWLAKHVPQDTAYLLRGKWNIAVMSLESGKYMRNPLRTLKEAVAISQSDDYDALQILRDSGVRVALMQGQSDRLTPTKKLWRRIGKNTESAFEKTEDTPSGYRWKGPNPQNNPPFDVITMVSSGHDNRIYGDSEKFARKILEELDFLNKSVKTKQPATV